MVVTKERKQRIGNRGMKIEVNEIQKAYGRRSILEQVSLTAGDGDCIGILGGNGSGKSTLLSVLAGVQRADGGSFVCDGEDLLGNTRRRNALVGYVPQENPLVEELSAWDNLRLWHGAGALRRELEGGVLALLGVDEFLKVPVRKMSGGMKKRLSIGCAVVSRPGILLLDEPSAALDLPCKERICRYFDSFRAQGGILLLATHDVQEISLCSHCYVLRQGRLAPYVWDGDMHRLAGELA